MTTPFPRNTALNNERLFIKGYNRVDKQDENLSAVPEQVSTIEHVPGEPTAELTENSVLQYLTRELVPTRINELYPHLWFVAARNSTNIEPLHRQKIKLRDIYIAEDPNLHLVWQRDTIYLKPVPLCLLNYDFWETYLIHPLDSTNISAKTTDAHEKLKTLTNSERPYALGFLRSYALLIQHRSDFELAKQSHLIPDDIDWIGFCRFIGFFRCISDDQVANRYRYGQLRLSRLNWATRIFQPGSPRLVNRFFFHVPTFSIVGFIRRAVAPLIFIFASLSLILSSMQILVVLRTDDLNLQGVAQSDLQAIRRSAWIFSVIVLIVSALIGGLLISIPTAGLIWQVLWGFHHREKPLSRQTANP